MVTWELSLAFVVGFALGIAWGVYCVRGALDKYS